MLTTGLLVRPGLLAVLTTGLWSGQVLLAVLTTGLLIRPGLLTTGLLVGPGLLTTGLLVGPGLLTTGLLVRPGLLALAPGLLADQFPQFVEIKQYSCKDSDCHETPTHRNKVKCANMVYKLAAKLASL